jgi:hypothetical protein
MATVGAQLGQSRTDHPLDRHLATSPVSASMTNSPSQTRPSLTVHATPDHASRQDLAVQCAQSMQRIPARLALLLHRIAHNRARH